MLGRTGLSRKEGKEMGKKKGGGSTQGNNLRKAIKKSDA